MGGLFTKRVGLAALGALAAVSVLFAILGELQDTGAGGVFTFALMGWVIPLVIAASVTLFLWLTMGQVRENEIDEGPVESACPSCGRPIMEDWRLCPDCGTLLESGAQGPKRIPVAR